MQKSPEYPQKSPVYSADITAVSSASYAGCFAHTCAYLLADTSAGDILFFCWCTQYIFFFCVWCTQNKHVLCPVYPADTQNVELCLRKKSPVYLEKSHIYVPKSHIHLPKSPVYSQKCPVYPQKRPSYPQKSPIYIYTSTKVPYTSSRTHTHPHPHIHTRTGALPHIHTHMGALRAQKSRTYAQNETS